MNNYTNFIIFIENLSSVYIFTTIILFISVISVIFSKYFNRNIPVKDQNTSDGLGSEEEEYNGNQPKGKYFKGLYGKVRSKNYLELKDNLTEDQLVEEKSIEQEQLAAIYRLLKEQEAELETNEFNENQLKEQLKLYR